MRDRVEDLNDEKDKDAKYANSYAWQSSMDKTDSPWQQRVRHKTKSALIRVIFSRYMITFLLILLQIAYLFMLFSRFFNSARLLMACSIISAIAIVYIINSEENPAFKLAWVIPICVVPVFGIMFYVLIQINPGNRRQQKQLLYRIEETRPYLRTERRVVEKMQKEPSSIRNISYYIQKQNYFPTYEHTQVSYFRVGEEKYTQLITDLKAAKKYIFLEYFIISPGKVWESVLSILKEKAQEGVEVRLMYDGLMSAFSLPFDYPGKLAEYGILVKKFSPIKPFLSTAQNSRDHRKIVVIDGEIAYTGGINLADEYMNEIVRFGHWKDTAVRLKGDAARSFTLMFLQMWYMTEKGAGEYEKYLLPKGFCQTGKGYVIPFNDDPTNRQDIAENVYLHLLYQAKKYVHIMTPYLIIDNEMVKALCFAAERGVDVRIVMPHIPDKKMILAIGRTYYPQLLASGVKIYEYTPGFVHAKQFVADDCLAVVGTVNLDYRSLYQHFECAALICENPVIMDIETDYQDTLKKCQKINMQFYLDLPIMYRLVAKVCRLFGPLV